MPSARAPITFVSQLYCGPRTPCARRAAGIARDTARFPPARPPGRERWAFPARRCSGRSLASLARSSLAAAMETAPHSPRMRASARPRADRAATTAPIRVGPEARLCSGMPFSVRGIDVPSKTTLRRGPHSHHPVEQHRHVPWIEVHIRIDVVQVDEEIRAVDVSAQCRQETPNYSCVAHFPAAGTTVPIRSRSAKPSPS